MVGARPSQGTPHLLAGLIASGLVAAVLLGAEVVAVRLERTTVRASAPELFSLKNQGLAFQRVAARSPYVLPLYGSSELTAVLGPGEGAHFLSHCANRFPSFARRRGRRELTNHVAKNRRAGHGLARQKGCYLAFARLVFKAGSRVVAGV